MVRIKSIDREEVLGKTRQALLDAAAEEFALHGFEHANINTISTRAGFAKGTVYNYFPSKQALILALIDGIAAEHLEYMKSTLAGVDDPAVALDRFFHAGFEYVAEHPHRSRVMFNAVNSPNQAEKEYCFQAYEPMFRLLTEHILVPGIQHRVFHRAELQPTASLLMTVYLGTSSQVDAQGKPWLDPRRVAEFALNGLRQEKKKK